MKWLSKMFRFITASLLIIIGLIGCNKSPVYTEVVPSDMMNTIDVIRLTMQPLNRITPGIVSECDNRMMTSNAIGTDLLLQTNTLYSGTIEIFTLRDDSLVNITHEYKDIGHSILLNHEVSVSLDGNGYLKTTDFDRNGKEVGFEFTYATFGDQESGKLYISMAYHGETLKDINKPGQRMLLLSEFPVTTSN